jgi:HPr kinase/phosphorylase
MPGGTPPADVPVVRVAELLSAENAALGLAVAAGQSGLAHTITMSRVQRPGLALTGYTEYLRYGRVQILGGSEMGYLARLAPQRRATLLSKLAACRISCFIVTKGNPPPAELLAAAEARGVPVLRTALQSTPFIRQLATFLEERLAPRVQRHGVLVDVFGLGVLILGDSGIGKSECALDLIDRGHRLVADDVVEIRRISDTLVGASPALTRYHMEVRGLGLINIEHLYGVSALRMTKSIDLVVNLERWEPGREYERLGVQDQRHGLLDVEVPFVAIPVAPGRNVALLVEVAARTRLLKERGVDAARSFVERFDQLLVSESERGSSARSHTGAPGPATRAPRRTRARG